MTITYTISRADLKDGRYKAATVQRSGTAPVKRDTELLVRLLKKVVRD